MLGNNRATNNVRVMQTNVHIEEINADRNSDERVTDVSIRFRVASFLRLRGLVNRMGRKWTYQGYWLSQQWQIREACTYWSVNSKCLNKTH